MYETRFGTYQVNLLVEETSLSPVIEWRPLRTPEIRPEDHFIPPPWDGPKKKHLLSLMRVNRDLTLKIFSRVLGEMAYPQAVQSSTFRIIPEDYYLILGMAGFMYDIAETSLISNISLDTLLDDREWEVLQLIVKLYLKSADLLRISSTQYLERMISQLTISGIRIHPLELFRLLQAVVTSQVENDSIYFKFREIESYLRLSLKHPHDFKEIPYYLIRGGEHSAQLAEEISLVLLSQENIITLLDDPNSPFASPLEFEPEIYQRFVGLSSYELRHNLLDLVLLSQEILSPKSSGQEIYLWYQKNGPNVLSQESLRDLVARLSKYPRDGWDSERIMMTARRLSSPNYSPAAFIREYDQEIIKGRESQGKKFTSLFQSLGPLYLFEPDLRKLLPKMIVDNAFRIPLLSPRGLLTVLSLIDSSGPPWIPALLQISMIRSDHENSIFRENVLGVQLAGAPGALIFKVLPEFLAAS